MLILVIIYLSYDILGTFQLHTVFKQYKKQYKKRKKVIYRLENEVFKSTLLLLNLPHWSSEL